jgi:hypothetical protein
MNARTVQIWNLIHWGLHLNSLLHDVNRRNMKLVISVFELVFAHSIAIACVHIWESERVEFSAHWIA